MFFAIPKSKPRKYRKSVYVDRGKWLFPEAAEREYMIFFRSILEAYKEEFDKRWPDIQQLLMQIRTRNDSPEEDLNNKLDRFRTEMSMVVPTSTAKNKLKSLSLMVSRNSEKEIKKAFKRTLGLDVFSTSQELEGMLDLWTEQNAQYIRSVPVEYLDRVAATIRQGAMQGTLFPELNKEVQRAYSVSENRAQLIARDQISKLNGNINQHLQLQAGIKTYEWQDSGDVRVRVTHAQNHGKIFSWDKGPPNTGNPGEDINCRCVGLPVFTLSELNIAGFYHETA